MAASLHGDVASAIGQQVEQMIMQAKKDSEARISHDLATARAQLQHMEALTSELTDRVARCARGHGGKESSQTVDQAFLKQNIEQLEQKWGSEVKALKQDLHRTILAHNHNSDLMRHHRDALDEARRQLDQQTQPKAEQVDAQIEKVDRMLRQGQAKQRALDAMTERLQSLEQQVSELFPTAPAMQAPFPGMMPGIGRMGGPMMASAAALSAQPKRAGKKEEGLEEEVRARLLAAARAPDGGASSFNAEAPVFVPGRPPQQEPAKAEGAAPADASAAALAGGAAALISALGEASRSGDVAAAVAALGLEESQAMALLRAVEGQAKTARGLAAPAAPGLSEAVEEEASEEEEEDAGA